MSNEEIPYFKTKEFNDKLTQAIQNYAFHPADHKLRKRDNLYNRYKNDNYAYMGHYNIDDIHKWLKNPNAFEDNIRRLSNFLYDTNPFYKLIVRYIALLPKYRWTLNIDSYGAKKTEKVKQDFLKANAQIEKMNLPFEMLKASIVAYKNDFFFGYEIETKSDYFILHLDNKYCKPSSIESGIYNFQFNFAYFDTYPHEIENFPIEFRRKYERYCNGRDKCLQWQELDARKSVCFKINIDVPYPIPMFAGMFPELYDLEDYKKLKKERAQNDNYMLLHQKIPMDEKEPDLNKFLIDSDLAAHFHDAASSSLPNGIEVVTSPMDITSVKTEKSKNDNDYVDEALRAVYDSGGISQFMFNSTKATSVGVNKSGITDEAIAFMLMRQMETWVNRKLKYMFNFKCNFKFLDVTIFNEKEVLDEKLKLAQNGFSKLDVAAVMGVSPTKLLNQLTLENDIFGLQDLMIPLSSTHTQSGDDEGGRPQASDNEISDEGQRSRDISTERG